MQCSEREARGQKRIRRRLVKPARIRDLAIINFKVENLRGVRLILPFDGG
jgi:hypothetical protein